MPRTMERRQETGGHARRKGARPRTASAEALRAAAAFEQLTDFYESDADLARALDISAESVRSWRNEPPTRPRAALRRRVLLLRQLCVETAPYLETSTDVGAWTLAPSPRLLGRSPAEHLRERGVEALRGMVGDLVDLVPRRPALELELPSGDELTRALESELGADALAEVDRMMGLEPQPARKARRLIT